MHILLILFKFFIAPPVVGQIGTPLSALLFLFSGGFYC
jgi:hypothetical protein